MKNMIRTLTCMLLALSFATAFAADKPKQFPPQMTNEDLDKNDAQWQCEQFILQSLDDGYKAKFEYFGNFPSQTRADGVTKVTATYTPDENSPKKKSECTMKRPKGGEWQLVGMKDLP